MICQMKQQVRSVRCFQSRSRGNVRLSHPHSKYIFCGPFTREICFPVDVNVHLKYLFFQFFGPFSGVTDTTDTSGYVCPEFQNQNGSFACVSCHLQVTDSSDSHLVRHLLTSFESNFNIMEKSKGMQRIDINQFSVCTFRAIQALKHRQKRKR